MAYGIKDVVVQRNFIESSEAPEGQKRIEHQKLNALLGFCEASRCRRQILLEYFGDSCDPCNNCDMCVYPPELFDGTEAMQKVLSTVYRTGNRFGVNYIIEVLIGTKNQRILNFRHDELSVYGVGKEYSKQEWSNIIRQLISQNLLSVDIANHGGMSITKVGSEYLRNRDKIRLKMLPKKKSGAMHLRETQAPREVLSFSDARKQGLYEALKYKRKELSQQQGVPPYVIFNDRTLYDIVEAMPQSEIELNKIKGVGQVRAERYGAQLLSLIRNYG